MNFLVHALIKTSPTDGIAIVSNLYQSFGTPEGFFIIHRKDLCKCTLLSQGNTRIVNVPKTEWENVLYKVSESEAKQALSDLGVAV